MGKCDVFQERASQGEDSALCGRVIYFLKAVGEDGSVGVGLSGYYSSGVQLGTKGTRWKFRFGGNGIIQE